ncbi:hypothetical protein CIG75_03330 [Tumebacillus algifaecis]|uniref:Transcription regulator PadR C-terminal domain-containing protein n=1 Tax=Tumebacillus algifaecis TaxID=1214604 RepID=A0A223CY02_9BACL|nr:hypothetical protein [Tumebacillus algifaecis]ASS74115.1 hypothetical protein CIG75_03330 [Tumebacillus algifaecis]
MVDTADGGQQMAYVAAVQEEELCRTLLEQLRRELSDAGAGAERIRPLYAQVEVGWRTAVNRVEWCKSELVRMAQR